MIRAGETNDARVVVVDDEPGVVEALVETLRRDFHVIGTGSPEEALGLLESEDVDCIISDQRMPAMSGADVLARSAVLSPTTVRLLITAYTDVEAIIQAINEANIYYYITKPWDNAHLVGLVREAVTNRRLKQENIWLREEVRKLSEEIHDEQQRSAAHHAEHETTRLAAGDLQGTLDELRRSYWHLEKIKEYLPICSVCGKVRDEKDEWKELHQVLKRRAEFLTHSYCPDCYGDLMKEMDQEDGA